MEIRKKYDIEWLKGEVEKGIERSTQFDNYMVSVHILTAQEIMEVLEETHRREQRHQTLESALTFMDKEDGTQTNLMEVEEKAPGHESQYKRIVDDVIHNLSRILSGEVGKRTDMLGVVKKCVENLEGLSFMNNPKCFGRFDDDDLDCALCVSVNRCEAYTKMNPEEKEQKGILLQKGIQCQNIKCEYNQSGKCSVHPRVTRELGTCITSTYTAYPIIGETIDG